MNFFQTTELQSLIKGLSEFGLQPHDWVLFKNAQNQIKIQHKHEPSFYFIGDIICRNGQFKWNSIQLASL